MHHILLTRRYGNESENASAVAGDSVAALNITAGRGARDHSAHMDAPCEIDPRR